MEKNSPLKDLLTFATLYSFLVGIAIFALVGVAVILTQVI